MDKDSFCKDTIIIFDAYLLLVYKWIYLYIKRDEVRYQMLLFAFIKSVTKYPISLPIK